MAFGGSSKKVLYSIENWLGGMPDDVSLDTFFSFVWSALHMMNPLGPE